MRKVLLLAVAILLLILPVSALADDSYAGGVGETPMPQNSKDIVMEKEVVNVTLHLGFAEVECAYQFKNEGKAQAVLMGFPERDNPEGDYVPIAIFRAFINGTEIPVKKTEITFKPGQAGYDEFGEKSNWFMQEVPFKAGETKVVVNRYIGSNGGTVSPDASYSTHFVYVLRTGGSWKGAIGRADVNIKFASGLSWYNFKPDPKAFSAIGYELPPSNIINPKGFTKEADGLSWAFKNINPKHREDDIWLTFYVNRTPGGPNYPAATASSWLDSGDYKYLAQQAFDGDATTAWAEAAAGPGIGESIKASFGRARRIEEVRILPGYTKRNDLFKKYSRPKAATIEFSDGTKKKVELDDDPRVQYFPLEKPVTARWAKLVIDEVYQGSGGADTYITEVEFGSKKTGRGTSAEEMLTGRKALSVTTTVSTKGGGADWAGGTGTTESSQSKNEASRSSEKRNPTTTIVIPVAAFALGVIVALVIITYRRKGKRG